MFSLTLLAVVVSFLALLMLSWQTRLLRKTLEAGNYQSLLEKIFNVREAIVDHPDLGKIFEDNPQIHATITTANMTMSEFFWALQFMTAWENFYQQRRMGLLGDESWRAYKNTLRLAFATPKLQMFWREFSQCSNYRSDWASFVDQICKGVDPHDPASPRWMRMFRKTT